MTAATVIMRIYQLGKPILSIAAGQFKGVDERVYENTASACAMGGAGVLFKSPRHLSFSPHRGTLASKYSVSHQIIAVPFSPLPEDELFHFGLRLDPCELNPWGSLQRVHGLQEENAAETYKMFKIFAKFTFSVFMIVSAPAIYLYSFTS